MFISYVAPENCRVPRLASKCASALKFKNTIFLNFLQGLLILDARGASADYQNAERRFPAVGAREYGGRTDKLKRLVVAISDADPRVGRLENAFYNRVVFGTATFEPVRTVFVSERYTHVGGIDPAFGLAPRKRQGVAGEPADEAFVFARHDKVGRVHRFPLVVGRRVVDRHEHDPVAGRPLDGRGEV